MKNINKSTVFLVIGSIGLGLFLGWFFFKGEPKETHTEHQHESNSVEEWTCSMHPQIRQKEAGKCPICGMDLIPVGSNYGDENPMAIKMSPTAMQLASVQTEIVEKKAPIKELRLEGKVQADESLISSQTTHISGRIEKLMINTTGEYVRKGQIIAFIYSPELVTAQEELFEAYKIKDEYPELYKAAKNKLKNWKLTDKQINAIIKSGKPSENFPILSDINGVVLQKRVNLGDHIKQGGSLFEIADLSKVWVLFDVYESDMTWVKVGDEIEYSIQSLPNQKFKGKVSFIDPVINPKTRVAKARVVASNELGQLKPEMFASGTLNSPVRNSEELIVIPKSAVMWTGEKSVVYVKTSTDKGVNFVMREITTGASLGKQIIINEGLKEGEEIATHGTFSIDAAAQLAGKPSMMNPEGGTTMTGHNHGGMRYEEGINSELYEISNEAKKAIFQLFSAYDNLKNALVQDDFNSAKSEVKSMINELSKIEMTLFEGDAHMAWMKHSKNLNESFEMMNENNDLKSLRASFVLLSSEMISLAKTFRANSETLFIQHCPMANSDKGASWISTQNEVKNPYFGASMLKCGSVTETLQ